MAKNRMKIIRFGLWLFTLSLLISWGNRPAYADEGQDPPVLTVSFPEGKGINEWYEDGTCGGMVYDWLIEISKYTGWKYEFIPGDASEMLNNMLKGEYDIMGGMFKQDALLEYFNYPDYSMGSNYSLLIYSKSDPTIKGFELSTLNGKTIGVLRRATNKIERLKRFLEFNDISCQLVYYDDEESYINCLDNKAVDLILGSDIEMKDTYNVAAKFESEPSYLVTAKDKPELCEQMNMAIKEIYSANPNFADELYYKYFPASYINSIDLTQEDKDYIAQAPCIRVAVIERRHPVHYVEDGEDRGILPEVLELISGRSGLQFEYVYADTYHDAIKLVQNGSADLFGGFMDNNYVADEMNLALTKSYAALDTVLLRNKRSTIPSDDAVMALPEGRTLTNRGTQGNVRYFSDYMDCIKAIDSGEADYTEIPFAYITDLYLDKFYANTTVMTADNLETNLSMALKLPVNVPLYTVLSKAINNISEQEIENILNRNMLSASETSITLKTLIYTEPVAVISVCIGIVILIFSVCFLAAQFRMKNRVMQLKLEKAEETARTKSDFLSRMSHEIRTPMNAIIGLTNLTQMSEEATPAVRQNLEKINVSARFLLSLINDVLDMSKINSQMMKINETPFSMDDIVEQMKDLFSIPAAGQKLQFSIRCQLEHHYYIGDEVRLKQILANLLSNAIKFTDPGGEVTLTIAELDCREENSSIRFTVKDTGIGIAAEDMSRIFLSFEQGGDNRRQAQGTGLGLPISSNLVKLMGGDLQVQSTLGSGAEFHFTLSLPVTDRIAAEEKPSCSAQQPLAGLRILLAEDNELNAEIAISLLEMQDVAVEWACDGRKAVECFASHPAGYYDLILMDLQMPVLDGLSATTEIRTLPREDAQTIPIIAMTANSFQEDRDRAAAAGMTSFLSKPFEVDKFYELLSGVSGKHNAERSADTIS